MQGCIFQAGLQAGFVDRFVGRRSTAFLRESFFEAVPTLVGLGIASKNCFKEAFHAEN